MLKMNRRPYIPQLNGLRFVAALMAVLSNMSLWYDVDPGFAREMDWGIFSGFILTPFRVDMFFILSGFILTYLYEGQVRTNKQTVFFYLKRLSRIYPLYALILFFILILYGLGIWDFTGINFPRHTGINRITEEGALLANFTLTSAWGFYPYKTTWNGPAWSLSAEWLSYLVFPTISFLCLKMKSLISNFIFICLLLLVFYFISQLYKTILVDDNGVGGISRSLVGFLIGINICKIYLSKKTYFKNINWDLVFVFFAGVYFLSLTYSYEVKEIPFGILYALLPLLFYSLLMSKTFVFKFFASPPMVYLGTLSYAIYLLHQPFFKVLAYFLNDYNLYILQTESQLLIFVNIVLCVLALIFLSHLIHSYFDKPLNRHLKRKMNEKGWTGKASLNKQ